MKTTILSAILLLAVGATAHAGDIYVSVTGNDKAAGTTAEPLLTVDAALRQAREWRRLGDERAAGGINIILKGGTYSRISAPMGGIPLREAGANRGDGSGKPYKKKYVGLQPHCLA